MVEEKEKTKEYEMLLDDLAMAGVLEPLNDNKYRLSERFIRRLFDDALPYVVRILMVRGPDELRELIHKPDDEVFVPYATAVVLAMITEKRAEVTGKHPGEVNEFTRDYVEKVIAFNYMLLKRYPDLARSVANAVRATAAALL